MTGPNELSTPGDVNGQPNGKRLRDYASVATAVVVVVGITAAVIAAWFAGLIESGEALAFLGPIAGAASSWLWVKQASKDAADAALAGPTPPAVVGSANIVGPVVRDPSGSLGPPPPSDRG